MYDRLCLSYGPVENAVNIFKCGSLQAPTKWRGVSASVLKAEDRNAPDDYVSKMKGEDKDLAAHFTIINNRGKRLYGKSIKETFANVPVQDYIDSIWNDIADTELAKNYARYMVEQIANGKTITNKMVE